MSTTPLTIVDGAMALPRSRPFNDVPAPFGRGWALLAPSHCLDNEPHGLYGAVLKTFDLSDQPIRSFCRWVAPDHRVADATAATIMGSATGARMPQTAGEREAETLQLQRCLASADSALADDPAATEASAFQEAFAPVKAHVAGPMPRVLRVPLVPLVPRWALAGGACALSGAALLAWTAFGHVDVRGPRNGNPTKRADIAVAEREAPAVQNPQRDTFGMSNKVAETTSLNQASAVSARQQAQAAPVSGTARTVAVGGLTLHPPIIASIEPHRSAAIVRTRTPLAVRNNDGHRTIYGHSPRASALNHRQHAEDGASTIATPPPVTRGAVKPSVAGSYSPPAPTQPGTGDYTFVEMSASTRQGSGTRPAQQTQQTQQTQPASSANLSASAGQHWSTRLTHRRVTEVPDQFIR
ncbi:hypothetical protein LMG28727_00340 [Paraburkholderia kirstenboschensis]|uniref:hypothetical protein n=1 Tax=Paraburkholderia kirstenboschensis TaxID=1245436 RepID=UPI00191B43A5|nr:hypothetical protein [Paraburkholderia kirstenboschensis]CAD6510415.1 hypothetical protein LMG28727_00340 [Paraburkholderia kirstenboschensis]